MNNLKTLRVTQDRSQLVRQEHASGGYKEMAGGWESSAAADRAQEKGIRGKEHSRKKCLLK